VVLAAGAGALGVRLGMPVSGVDSVEERVELGVGEAAEAPFLDGVVGLVWRAVVVWVFVLLLLAVASALPF
jgi:cobalamin biosynthesis protein CobD/CbiB